MVGLDAHSGCYGCTQQIWAPNLDRLAEQGTRYTHFHAGMVCSVSRSSFMKCMCAVSIVPHQHRTQDKRPLPEGVRTLSDWMREPGYFTANIRRLPASLGFKGTGKTDWDFTVR